MRRGLWFATLVLTGLVLNGCSSAIRSHSPASALRKGVLLASKGEYESAARIFRRVARTSMPEVAAAAWNNLAVVESRLGRLDRAAKALSRALDYAPQDPVLHYNLGLVLMKAGRIREAIAHFRRAARLRPTLVLAWNNLAVAYFELGDLARAEAAIRRALKVRPDYAAAWNNLGVFLLKQGRRSEARTAFLRAVHNDPKYAPAKKNLQAVR